jgi:hypothetical protein
MARTEVTVTKIDRNGSDVATLKDTAIADNNSFPNNGQTFLQVDNGDASPVTVTVQTPRQVDGLDVAEYTLSVGASERQIFGPFPTETFNQTDGTVYINWSSVTSLTFEAFTL